MEIVGVGWALSATSKEVPTVEYSEGRAEGHPPSNQSSQSQGSFGKAFDIEPGDDNEGAEDPDAGDAELTNGTGDRPDGSVDDPWMRIPQLSDLLEKLFTWR